MKSQNATYVWLETLRKIMSDGVTVSPRYMGTREILSHTSVVDMHYPIVSVDERKLGYKFMAAEAAWIMSGDNRVETIAPFSKDISHFSDDGLRFFGAYGPRIIDQLSYICRNLAEIQDTRQAALTIWRQNPLPTKDVPCTISVQWLIRDGKLHCFDTMRSSDIWLGWPYDVFNFSMLSYGVRAMLRDIYDVRVEIGDLYLTAASQHLYERNVSQAKKIYTKHHYPQYDISAIGELSYDQLVSDLWFVAKKRDGALDIGG